MENVLQNQEQKAELIRIGNFSKAIPTSKSMVSVASLLTQKDLDYIKEESLGTIAVKVESEVFFLSTNHKVPATAVLPRDTQGQIIGIKAIVGG